MTRLEAVDVTDVAALTRALERVLAGEGPALALGDQDPALSVPAGTAVVLATSGSTGVPKRVMLTADALRASAAATAARVGDGAWLLALPAGYVAGLQVVVRSILRGSAPTVVSGSFSASSFVAAVAQMPTDAPRFTSLVPAQLSDLLSAAESDATVAAALRSLEAILVGGQLLAPVVRERAADAGVRVVRTYGSTETSGGCVYDGVPLKGVQVRVVADEVQLAGSMLASRYLGDPALSARVFVTDADDTRWYRTGDGGTWDGKTLSIHGRLDNVLISGGINVSVDRVEQWVRTIPELADAVVVVIPDERWGEASVIMAATTDARRAAQRELLERARSVVGEHLGAPARPVRLALVPDLPSLPSGKPDRAQLRLLTAQG